MSRVTEQLGDSKPPDHLPVVEPIDQVDLGPPLDAVLPIIRDTVDLSEPVARRRARIIAGQVGGNLLVSVVERAANSGPRSLRDLRIALHIARDAYAEHAGRWRTRVTTAVPRLPEAEEGLFDEPPADL